MFYRFQDKYFDSCLFYFNILKTNIIKYCICNISSSSYVFYLGLQK